MKEGINWNFNYLINIEKLGRNVYLNQLCSFKAKKNNHFFAQVPL